MKKLSIVLLVCALAVMVMPACKKNKDGGGGTNEVNLVVETTPNNGATEAPAPGPDFPLKVEIKSTMPPSGVKIEVSARQDGSTAAPFFSTSSNTTSASNNNFTITNTPKTVICVVDVKVTSISKPTNVWTGSYKYSKK
jgi:hypothetical protein